jgi:photosystem II stability/assembly factor-like uncharacterized protein
MNSIHKLIKIFFIITFYFSSMNAQWIRTYGPRNIAITSLASNGSNLFAGTGMGGIFISTNNGSGWAQLSVDTTWSIYTIFVNNNNLFAGTYPGARLSTNNGTTWSDISTGLPSEDILSFTANSAYVFSGTSGHGVYRSTNNGASWTSAGLTSTGIRRLIVRNGYIYAATASSVYVSTDNGSSWMTATTGLGTDYIEAFAMNDSNVFAGTFESGVFRSTDNGSNWTAVNTGLPSTKVNALLSIGNTLLAGTNNNGIYLSMNNGSNWSAVNNGLTDLTVKSITLCGTNLFIGTDSTGVWRRALSEIITGIENNQVKTPRSISLEQNYPNPFNPSTTIKFSLVHSGHVSLKIYSILGKLIATLVNDNIASGDHQIQWNAEGLSSGTYYCRLQSGSAVETKKLVLLK